jgi:hypothetical protein
MALPGWLFLFIIPVCGSEMGQKEHLPHLP